MPSYDRYSMAERRTAIIKVEELMKRLELVDAKISRESDQRFYDQTLRTLKAGISQVEKDATTPLPRLADFIAEVEEWADTFDAPPQVNKQPERDVPSKSGIVSKFLKRIF